VRAAFVGTLLGIAALAAGTLARAADRGYPPLPATGCPALADFHRGHVAPVTALAACASDDAGRDDGRIVRGGAPTAAGLACLRSQGVTTVIDLRADGETPANARRLVEAAGMSYQHFPMVTGGAQGGRSCQVPGRAAAACNARALDQALTALAAALAASPQAKVYVHCSRGEDRTSLVIAALRLRQKCSPEAARREMRAYQYWPYAPLEAVWQQMIAEQPAGTPDRPRSVPR